VLKIIYKYYSEGRIQISVLAFTIGNFFQGLLLLITNIPGDTYMPSGTVKWFNNKKGFGFIVPETGGQDVFVHISAVEKSGMKSLEEGQKVSFELAPDREGRMTAVNLKAA